LILAPCKIGCFFVFLHTFWLVKSMGAARRNDKHNVLSWPTQRVVFADALRWNHKNGVFRCQMRLFSWCAKTAERKVSFWFCCKLSNEEPGFLRGKAAPLSALSNRDEDRTFAISWFLRRGIPLAGAYTSVCGLLHFQCLKTYKTTPPIVLADLQSASIEFRHL